MQAAVPVHYHPKIQATRDKLKLTLLVPGPTKAKWRTGSEADQNPSVSVRSAGRSSGTHSLSLPRRHWLVSIPLPPRLAALSIIYSGCPLEDKPSRSGRSVCQTYADFPVVLALSVQVET